MSIPLVNLKRMHDALYLEIRAAVNRVIARGDFVLGSELEAFEEEFADFCEARHCIGVGSGLDALEMAIRGLGIGPGDEVITTANTYIATALAIYHTGATPVLVDHDPDTYNLDPKRLPAAISSKTKAILPVHLYGQPAEMDLIRTIADEHGLIVIEDAAQAHGARYKGRRCGGLGQAGCFSFYPGKNLGSMGDGGAIVTNDDALAQWLKAARSYGSTVKYYHKMPGWNCRLDNLQAAILRVKLRYLDEWNALRCQLAARYRELLASVDVVLPAELPHVDHIYHLFVIRSQYRNELLAYLNEQGIGAGIHYPLPIHRQTAMSAHCIIPGPLVNTDNFCDQLLSLPICPYTSRSDVETVARAVADFTATAAMVSEQMTSSQG